jgi:thiosulfate/3-mercaptopyruvate sulfurtransferase
VEGWFKVYIGGEDGKAFLASAHAQRGCVGCHGGVEGETSKDEAHVGMRPDPSEGVANSCNDFCHAGVANYSRAVHSTQAGYLALFERRSGLDLTTHPDLSDGFASDCASCHASCGDCHISQPKNVGGGLITGHRINKTPDMTRNCTACHGSRVGDEYRGQNDYASADVHYRPGAMTCMGCHTGAEMHGDGTRPERRYAVANMPQCVDCHDDVATANDYHNTHFDDMSCQVCHSQTYKGCNSCHVGEGITGSSYPIFKIGRNPIPELRDREFVLLRHVPLSPDTFEGWGLPDLEFFESEPTWKYTSPHNIRRWTERTQVADGLACYEACHNTPDGQEGWFFRAADLQALPDAEQAANAQLIVPDGSPFTW